MKEHLLIEKVGTSSLVDDSGRAVQAVFDGIADQNVALSTDFNFAEVSSGAVSTGAGKLGLDRADFAKDKTTLRVMASVGQAPLSLNWDAAYARHGFVTGQCLVTPLELRSQEEGWRYLATLGRMFELGVVPIINENDAIADEEITFGDNDFLAADLALRLGKKGIWESTKLILLSDVGALYDDFGGPNEERIPVVTDIRAVRHLGKGSSTKKGTGGMASKVLAAEKVLPFGIDVYVADASVEDAIPKVMDGEIGTHFVANAA
jgi:glutamate 5-kinase